MEQILTFIDRCTPEQGQILHELRLIVLDAAPAVEEAIKWKIPFYAYQGLLCYFNPQPGCVVMGFCRGALLSNEQGLLEGKGKEVRLLKIPTGSQIPKTEIRQLLQEAIILNETMQRRKNYYV